MNRCIQDCTIHYLKIKKQLSTMYSHKQPKSFKIFMEALRLIKSSVQRNNDTFKSNHITRDYLISERLRYNTSRKIVMILIHQNQKL